MEKDLISNFDINDIDKNLARRNSKMSLGLLLLSVVFLFMEILDWYGIFMRSLTSKASPDHFFYLYRVAPIITFSEIVLVIIYCGYFYNGWKYLSKGIDEADTMLFNKGLKFSNIALILSLSYYLLYFSRVALRSIYYQW